VLLVRLPRRFHFHLLKMREDLHFRSDCDRLFHGRPILRHQLHASVLPRRSAAKCNHHCSAMVPLSYHLTGSPTTSTLGDTTQPEPANIALLLICLQRGRRGRRRHDRHDLANL
jgi:hypothetical protein